MSETPNHNLLTVKETAEYLRIPLPTVYYLVQRGQIPAIQIGGRWRIKKSSLDRDILRQDKQGQPTVLVVDDDPELQELFKSFLKKIGFSRVVVGTAKDAIHSLRKQKFDLMFLDLQLPDGTGDEVYKTAKQIDPDLNVIVITGYPDSEMLDRILQISPVTVLKKPLKIEQLNQTVKILGHTSSKVERMQCTGNRFAAAVSHSLQKNSGLDLEQSILKRLDKAKWDATLEQEYDEQSKLIRLNKYIRSWG